MDNVVNAVTVADDPASTKNSGKISRILGRAILYLILIIGAIIFIFPFFWMIPTLMTLGKPLPQLLPKVPQWENYRLAWEQKQNFQSILSTLVYIGHWPACSSLLSSPGYAFPGLILSKVAVLSFLSHDDPGL